MSPAQGHTVGKWQNLASNQALNHCSFPWAFETEITPGPKTNLAPRMAGADDLKGPAMLNLPAGLPHFSKC